MKESLPTHAFVAMADGAIAQAIAQALDARGWSADIAAPNEAPAALHSGRYGAVIAEVARSSGMWRELAAPVQPACRARLVAVCRPEDAFFALREALPCGYVLQPLDAPSVADLTAALARGHTDAVALQVDDGIVLDTQARRVFGPDGMWQLRPREFDLLRLLVSRRGQVVTRDETIRHLYRWGEDIGSNAVDVHIHSLRRQLGHLAIRTVRGEGYVLCGNAPN